jgi:hypothetical protein
MLAAQRKHSVFHKAGITTSDEQKPHKKPQTAKKMFLFWENSSCFFLAARVKYQNRIWILRDSILLESKIKCRKPFK